MAVCHDDVVERTRWRPPETPSPVPLPSACSTSPSRARWTRSLPRMPTGWLRSAPVQAPPSSRAASCGSVSWRRPVGARTCLPAGRKSPTAHCSWADRQLRYVEGPAAAGVAAAGLRGDGLRMSPKAAVLLDVDGTLVDSNYHHVLAWARALARYDLTPSLWRVHRHIGMGGDQFVAAVAGKAAEERHGDALREAWGEEFDKLLDEVHAVPRATELLQALRERGWPVVLASSGKP